MDFTLSSSALALVPVVMALTSLSKMYIDSKWAPLVSLGIGIIGAFLVPSVAWQGTVLTGIVMGLTASGVYSGAKSMVS